MISLANKVLISEFLSTICQKYRQNGVGTTGLPFLLTGASKYRRCGPKLSIQFVKPCVLGKMEFVLSNERTVQIKQEFQSPKTIQIDNRDGTTTLKVQEKSLYFRDIANELHNTYQQYSDVKIVCGDGARFDANKSILSRSKYLSEYLQMPEIQLQERAWLIIPDVSSSMMETALQWFYGNSTDVKNIESFDILENVFGIAMLKTPDVIKKEPELSTLEAEDKDDWSLFCQKDSTSRLYKCPLCEETFSQDTEVKLHIHSHGLEIQQCEMIAQQTSKSKSKFVCFLCKKTFESKSILYRHVAWRHFKEKVLFLSQRLCKKKSCFPEHDKLRAWAAHLAIKHRALEHCLTEKEFSSLRRKIILCSHCRKQISERNITRHERLCLERSILLEFENDDIGGLILRTHLPESEKENGDLSHLKNGLENVKYQEKSVSKDMVDTSQPVFQSPDDKFHPIILKPYALNVHDEKAFTQKYVENQEHKKAEIQSWNSNIRMVAKSGSVYVLKGKIGLSGKISKADNYIWRDKGSFRTAKWRYRRFLAIIDESELSSIPITPGLRKRVTYIPHISIYIIHYYGGSEKSPSVENLSAVNIKHETLGPDCFEGKPSSPRGVTKKKVIPKVGTSAIKTETEEPSGTTLNNAPPTAPHIITPFATNQSELTNQFLEDNTLEMPDDLPVYTQSTTMEAKEGNIFIFAGPLDKVSLIKNADGLRWSDAGGRRIKNGFHFLYFIQVKCKTPLRKRLIYNCKTSIFVSFYYKRQVRAQGNRGGNTTYVCSSRPNPMKTSDKIKPKKEISFEDNNLSNPETEQKDVKYDPLKPEKGVISSQTISPHLTNVFKTNGPSWSSLKQTEKNGLQEWTSNMQLDSKVGNVYVFRGSQVNFHEILNGDDYYWRKTSTSQCGNFKNDSFRAKVNINLMTARQFESIGGRMVRNDVHRKSHLGKRITFDLKNSVYIVHYFENGISLPLLKRPPRDIPDMKLFDESISQDSSQSSDSYKVDVLSFPATESIKRVTRQSLSPRKRYRSEDQAALKTREMAASEENKRRLSETQINEL